MIKQKILGGLLVAVSVAFLVIINEEDAAAGILYLLLGLYLILTKKNLI